ncbi:hypothetical protein D3C81_1285900 [compost metagenome]
MGGPQVAVTIKVPEGASPKAIEAEYLSDQCFPKQHGSFNSYGSEKTKVKPVRQGDSDLYQARLDLDGGGFCRWRLTLVKVGVQYWRAGLLGLSGSIREEVTGSFELDHRAGNETRLSDEELTRPQVTLRPDYYPFVFPSGSGYDAIEFVWSGDRYARSPAARSLVFEPRVHRDMVVRVGLDDHRERTFIFPDGSVEAAGSSRKPDARKLEAMRGAVP